MNGLSNKVNFLGRTQKLADRTVDRTTYPWMDQDQTTFVKTAPFRDVPLYVDDDKSMMSLYIL